MQPDPKESQRGEQAPAESPGRQPWKTPQLRDFGSVDELTAGFSPGAQTGDVVSSQPSHSSLKEDFAPVDGDQILARLGSLPVSRWRYVGDPTAARHIGPMAEDFASAFEVGTDSRVIHHVDANGIALAAIKALEARVRAQEVELTELRALLGDS